MEAQEQKQLAAKQSSKIFNQHHQVHQVRHHGNETTHRDAPTPSEATNETGSNCFCVILLTVSLCCLQKREKRKEEEQRRKQWVDQEREKTLSRLRSFREVRLCHCLCTAPHCSFSFINKTSEAPAS